MSNILLLNKQEQNLYDKLLYTIQKDNTEIEVPIGINIDRCLEIIKIVLGENQKYFYYDNCQISYYKRDNIYLVRLSKWLSPIKKEIYSERLIFEAKEIISKTITSKMNKLQKILAIHNYLVDNVNYYQGSSFISNYQQYHTAYGAIVNKNAVCEGIATAYCFLLSLVGIKSTIVNGYTCEQPHIGHSWNIVEVSEKYYHIDVTWDLKNKSEFDFTSLDYFALKDTDLSNRKWNKSLYHICDDESLNFFYLTKAIAHSDKDLIDICRRQIEKNKKIYIKCPYLSAIKTENELCDYIYNIMRNDLIITNNINQSLTFHTNLDQTIIQIC